MVLIYVEKTSVRLQYTAALIFKDILKVSYAITEHEQGFKDSQSFKVNYSHQAVADDELRMPNFGLLHQAGITPQPIEMFDIEGLPVFFKSLLPPGEGFPFDLFSSTFYLASRYEEYLPHKKDKFGRYLYGNSLAFQEDFLHIPLVNVWLSYFADYLKALFPSFEPGKSTFHFIPTYNVDTAYRYLQEGFMAKTIRRFRSLTKVRLKDLKHRLKELAGIGKHYNDGFDWLNSLHQQYGLRPLYFFLVAATNGVNDNNLVATTSQMHHLIADTVTRYAVGLQPSWQSGDDMALLQHEKDTLENLSGISIEKGRQHYLRFNLPEGYRRLVEAGLTEDYSMGYGSINGFRASLATPFFWYDLEKEVQTKLKVFPFCYMDSVAITSLELSVDEALDELTEFYTVCKDVQGTFSIVLHNHLLGSDQPQWRNLYERFLKTVAADISA